MSEADEVAASLLPGYLAQREERWKQGRLGGAVETYVWQKLGKTESITVMDNVTESLQRLVRVHDNARNQK